MLSEVGRAVADAIGRAHGAHGAHWDSLCANVTFLTRDTVQEAIVGTDGGVLSILLVRSVRAINKL